MAQSGYTPISLYYSATGAAVPSAGNLVAGELALNTNDGKLYFKNSAGVVTLLAGSTSGPAGGSTTQVQYNNAGVLAGITGATTNGTALTLVAPNLGSPSSVGTMPAFTLGGTVSGGGNQINNVVIGTTTPLAGAFTTLSATSDLTVAQKITTTSTSNDWTNIVIGNTTSSQSYGTRIQAGTTAGDYSFLVKNATNATEYFSILGNGAAALGNGLAVTGALSSTLGATIQGLTVGLGAGAVATNTAVGVSALAASASGTYSTGIGYQALNALTTGNANTAVGGNAMVLNTSGVGNSGFGTAALYSNVSGSNNTAIGSNALLVATASNNTAVGYQVLYSTTTGYANIAVGRQTLYSNTTGLANTGMGDLALYNATASFNSAFGQNTLYSTTTGGNNSAFGSQALFSNTTASNNTAVGYQAGYSTTTGGSSVFFGYQAGYAITGGGNVIIGSNAGYASGVGMTTGTSNIIIGSSASASAVGDTQSITILAADSGGNGKGSSTGFINPNGGGVYQGNNSLSWSITSDQRIKKNIVDNNIGLSVINQIQVRNFEYRLPAEITELPQGQAVAKTGVQLGVIAQELQQVLPECIKTESTGVMSVNADNLTWYLVNAIKELTARVAQLESKL